MNTTDKTALKLAVRAFYDFQDMRTRMGNRIKIKKNGEDQIIPEEQQDGWAMTERDKELFKGIYGGSANQEQVIEKYIKQKLKEFPIYTEWLSGVKGVGPMMAAVIVSEYNIHIATTVSKLWAFTGLAPGKDRLKKGEKAPFNKWLRTKMCGVLGSSFLKCNSPYRKIYDDEKHRLENEVGWKEESALHRHRAATRKMIKQFLKDLYTNWRTIENLPVRKPYQEEYLGHTHNAA
jgi:hypothetical protein